MANTILTVNEIAKESLMRLQNNLVLSGLVHRDFSNEYASQGQTISVKKPATFVANDFTGTTSAQNISEGSVPVTLDTISDVTVEVTSKELSLNIQDFGTQVVDGAMQAIAQKIDEKIAGLYADIPYVSGTAGTTPAALANIANVGKVLNTNKVPLSQRRLVIDPEAQAKLIVLDAIAGADKSGSTEALRNANMGRILGFDTYMDQNIKTHVKGTLAGNPFVKTEVAAGGTQVTFAGATGLTGTAKVGDVFTVADADGEYVVTEVNDMVSDEQTVKFYPAAKETFAATKAVTFTGNHVANMAFHRNAFALVNRPMALPLGGANGYVANYNGLSIRVTMGYTMSSKINTISFDILYGVKTLQPELAVRMLG